MQEFGLIGKSLVHSFSQKYFQEKFSRENIQNCRYSLFELESLSQLKPLLTSLPTIRGLNITIPYKQEVLPLLDFIDSVAESIGAVNTILIEKGKLKGFNTDYLGFRDSLLNFIPQNEIKRAMVLGTGGSAKAVIKVLNDLSKPYISISRRKSQKALTYEEIDQSIIRECNLIINTTPLGMFPQIESKPAIPYNLLTKSHYLFDLVYNPQLTSFLKAGLKQNTKIKNGEEMFILQAEHAWKIWTERNQKII